MARTVRLALYTFALLLCGSISLTGAQEQSDPEVAATRAYREKNYPAFLENVRRLSDRYPRHAEVLEWLARAYALNGKAGESLATLDSLARMGGAPNLDHPDFALLKGRRELKRLRAAVRRNAAPKGRSTAAFKLAEKDLIPEGIAYDPVADAFYVGSIYRRKIVRVARGGRVTDFTSPRQDGLLNVLGLRVDAGRRLLWACAASGGRDEGGEGSSALFKYDLESGRLIKKYESARDGRKHLFNDIALSSSGDLFVTDSLSGSVLKLPRAADALETFIGADTFIYPNGVAVSGDGRYLFVADARGVSRVGLADKTVRPLAAAGDVSLAGFDGLYWHAGGLIGVQNGFKPVRVVRVELDRTLGRAVGLRVLESNNPLFNIPTTGVVARGRFHYIANSQLRSLDEREAIPSPESLKEPVILALPLR
ncbi:MAG: gluconolaconase [Acidobacteriota bacterium]|nr:gluconolaconase [Acidobacteriota bacterium]